jgi:hypothetical protein
MLKYLREVFKLENDSNSDFPIARPHAPTRRKPATDANRIRGMLVPWFVRVVLLDVHRIEAARAIL